MTEQKTAPRMVSFGAIWFGQLISMVGSQLTGIAMGIWVYETTHSVSLLAATQIASQAPYVLLGPLAGVLADRWNRGTAMLISDFGGGLGILTAALLFVTGNLQPWMVILLNIWVASFNALMWPAYSAAVTLLVPKAQYGRANGLVQMADAMAQIGGPALAGLLYVTIKLGNLAFIDAATYAFSVILLLFFIRIPNPERSEEGNKGKGSMWKEMAFGLKYVSQRPGLLSLLIYFSLTNFLFGFVQPLFLPLILDNWSADVFGYLATVMGVGMLAGTVVMSAWGGGKRKAYTLLASGVLGSLFLIAAGIRASIPLLAVAGFGMMFTMPIGNASSQAIWQAKVAPDLQGRVFAARRTIAWGMGLISPLMAAPLVDFYFKPAMAAGGSLAPIFGPIFGVGAGRGIGVFFSLIGVILTIVGVAAFFYPRIRRVELEIPDHKAEIAAEDVAAPLGDQAVEGAVSA